MREVELLVFEGFDDLAARLLPGIADGLPKGKVAVHTGVDPNGKRAVLVEAIGQAITAPAGVKKIAARYDTATRRVLTKRALFETVLYEVERTEIVESLVHALKPTPLEEPPDLGRDGHVIVWCEDASHFANVVRQCLALSCDRIRWAPVGAKGARGAVLARIDSPPWFLLERWSRETDASAVYAPQANGFYVRWGWTHPLAGRLALGEGEIAFVDTDGMLKRVPAHEWRDVYDALSIAAEGLASQRWNAADPAPRFTVTLRMVAAPEPVEPELWLLSKDDLPAVERLLGLMPEADLKHLAIAFFEGTSEGQPVAALREVITGRGRGWVSFGRSSFRALPGLPNLFLPVDRALDPQVRRDRVADAFALKSGEFLIAEPAGELGMRGLRIAETAFKPLSSYVDYVVSGDAPRLQSLVAASVFDPGPLAALAEAGPDPRSAGGGPRAAASITPVKTAADGGQAEPAPAAIEIPDEDPATHTAAEEPVRPAQNTEQQIEAAIAGNPPGAGADWLSLGIARAARSEWEGAVECFENARWADRTLDERARTEAMAALEAQLAIPKEAPPARRAEIAAASADGPGDVRALRLRALYLESGLVEPAPAYLEALYASARAAGDRMRKKTRWLVWRALLGRTGDDIECERQREQILGDLNQGGLSPLDRTDFVRARLAELALDGGGEHGELRRTMEGLTERLGKIEDARLRWTGMSLLARRWAELDDVPRARKLAQDAASASRDLATGVTARVLANASAALLRIRDSAGAAPFVQAVDIARRLSNGDDRGRTLHAMLEALTAVNDPQLTRPLVDAALTALEGEDARRAAITLNRCSASLRKLEHVDRARTLALQLCRDPRVQQDAHYLANAVGALATLAGSRSLTPQTLGPILDAVRRHMRDLEDVQVRLMEGAVLLAGEDFAREVSDQMRAASPAEMRFSQLSAWGAAIQGLAVARAVDTGLSDLERAMKLAWALPNDDERRRSVKRLAGCAASFGRVQAGLAIVHDVVRRTEAPGVGPYFRSEVLSECVNVAARLGQRQGAFEVMNRVIALVESTARGSAGDVTFLFDVLGLCVDHAVTIGAPGESAAVIKRVESLVEEWMDESSVRYWTPFYRYRALAKCGRGFARLGQEEAGLVILRRILDATPTTQGLDRIDLLREIVHSLSEVGGAQRLVLVDRVLDGLLSEKQLAVGEAGGELLAMVLDEVVSPASRVRAEYARFLGADERNIRDRVANEKVITR